jgi:hypothetical protein
MQRCIESVSGRLDEKTFRREPQLSVGVMPMESERRSSLTTKILRESFLCV